MSLEDSALASLLTPDTLTPEQWADGRKARNLPPEAELYFAVLHDAVDCLRYRDIKTTRRQKLYRDAAAWLAGEGDPQVTVEMCCDVLDIDLEYLRRGLQSYMPKKLFAPAVCRYKAEIQPQYDRRDRDRLRPPRGRSGAITPEEALRIVDMYRAGASIPDIREAVRVSYGTIYKIVNQFLKPEEKRPAGRAATMEAKRERIRQLRERGMGIDAIAKQMHVSTTTVYKALGQDDKEAVPQPEPANEAVQLGLYD